MALPSASPISIGEGVKKHREAKSLSSRTLAKQTGLSASSLSQIERGESSPSIASLQRLAHALGSDVTNLLQPGPPPKSAVIIRAWAASEPGTPFHTTTLGFQLAAKLNSAAVSLQTHASLVLPDTEISAYIASGSAQLHTENKVYSLEAGDSIHLCHDATRLLQANESGAQCLLITSGHPDSFVF